MFTLANLAELVTDLKGEITEPGRTLLAKRLANLIGSSLQQCTDPTNYAHWTKTGCRAFFAHCQLTCPEKWVPDQMKVNPTALSEFCNKWMSVAQFKLRDATEWQAVTPELNGLRVTMIEELLTMSKNEVDKPPE
jgi:hypothetical protein